VAVIFHIKPWANAPFCPFNDPRLSAKKWRSFDHCHLVVRQIEMVPAQEKDVRTNLVMPTIDHLGRWNQLH
jgi:hypothetical protein